MRTLQAKPMICKLLNGARPRCIFACCFSALLQSSYFPVSRCPLTHRMSSHPGRFPGTLSVLTRRLLCVEKTNNDEFDQSDDVQAADLLSPDVKRWPMEGRTLSVYVSETVQKARNGKVKQIIDESLRSWCGSLNNTLTYKFTNDFKIADIYFLQRDTANHEWADNERFYSKKGGLYMVKVSILERTVNELPEKQLKALMLHQSGHALGLIEHLHGDRDAMSENVCSTNTKVNGLSQGDKSEMRALYVSSNNRHMYYSKPQHDFLKSLLDRVEQQPFGPISHR